MEIETQLEMHDQNGRSMHASIVQVGNKTVRLDFNHPMAGKEIHISTKIVGLHAATPEEQEHGHVHGDRYE